MTEVNVVFLPDGQMKRGPGGNWFRYRATMPGSDLVGYGTTEREARRDLESLIDKGKTP